MYYVISNNNNTCRYQRNNAIHADGLTPKLHLPQVTLYLCASSMLCVKHATCCLAFRGSHPVIGD